jgi:uncharacterized protein YjbJ (UPF0337 family)
MAEGRYDELKGRAKQAAGDLADDDELRRSGKADEASGKVKQAVEHAKDKVEEGVDRAKDRVKDMLHDDKE